MNDLERFKAICRGEKPDYVPIFGFPGAPGVSQGAMKKTHQRLVEQGMPEWVDGCHSLNARTSTETWMRYWGTTGPLDLDFFPADPGGPGIRVERRIEGEWEIIESETGALTRQVVDNDITYSMPHFIVYDVRDRASWEFYRERTAPGPRWSTERIHEACRRFDRRTRPLCVSLGSTWGYLRGLMGPEKACTVLYDDPALAHEILDWCSWVTRTYLFPVVERLRPEIVATGEDNCYNHGMIISPAHFREFCAPAYREIGELARNCGVDMVAVDTDGNMMELVGLLEECGVNALFPCEVKAGNDLFALRERHAEFVFLGWLEKEVLNEGNEGRIDGEVRSKVPALLEKGRYLPNGDHGIQPLVSFEGMGRFMTVLHEVTANPEGEYPRIRG